MKTNKAAQIFDIVNSKIPLQLDTPIFFEYGDDETPTSVYKVEEVEHHSNQVRIKMSIPPTVCKPRLSLEVVNAQAGGCGNGQSSCC